MVLKGLGCRAHTRRRGKKKAFQRFLSNLSVIQHALALLPLRSTLRRRSPSPRLPSIAFLHFNSSTFPKLISISNSNLQLPSRHLQLPQPLTSDQLFLVLILTLTIKGESAGADGRSVSLTEGVWTGAKEGKHCSAPLLIHQAADRPPCLGEHEGRGKAGAVALILHYVIAEHRPPQQGKEKTPLRSC